MADIKSPEKRSQNMAKIRSKDTKAEVYLRKELFRKGYRYRKNSNSIPGHPDIWLPKYKTAVFVHGCFWHRHKGCMFAYMPKSRVDFWTAKFNKNVERDQTVKLQLCDMGVKMLIVWECTLKEMRRDRSRYNDVMDSIESFFDDNSPFLEL